jgi:hypothetical protein
MTTQASSQELLPLFITPDLQEWIPDLRPHPDGIRVVRGILLGVALCMPVWVLVCWAVAVH